MAIGAALFRTRFKTFGKGATVVEWCKANWYLWRPAVRWCERAAAMGEVSMLQGAPSSLRLIAAMRKWARFPLGLLGSKYVLCQ